MNNKVLAAFLIPILAVGCLAGFAGQVDAGEEPTYTKYWSWTLGFTFTGSDAQSIEWDFGDGSPVLSGDIGDDVWTDVRHEFPHVGGAKYTVKQTVTNTMGSSTTERQVQVMGPPILTFAGNHIDLDPIEYKKGNVPVQPAAPVHEGSVFKGWYADAAGTVPFDWSEPMTGHRTAYALWEGEAPQGDGNGFDLSAVALVAIGMVVLIAGLALIVLRKFAVGAVLVLVGAIVLAWHFGLFDFPKIELPWGGGE